MIEINLLPGGRRKSTRGGGPKVDVSARVAALREKIREPWLIGSGAVTAVVLAVIGFLYFQQSSRETALNTQLEVAVQDSTRYASVLKQRERAEARRDTVLRSLNLIRAIDDDRFIWPHVMEEVSRALPPYTWVVSLGFSERIGPTNCPTSRAGSSTTIEPLYRSAVGTTVDVVL